MRPTSRSSKRLIGACRRVQLDGGVEVDSLIRQPSTRGIAVGGLPGNRHRDSLQRIERGDRPVAAKAHPGSRLQQRADRVLPGAPLFAESWNGQLHHRRFELSPDRFEVGDHVEFRETTNVVGMDQLGMGDGRPPIPVPVLSDRRLDGVESVADPGVADGVDVDLKAVAIERQDRFASVLPGSSWRSRGSRDCRSTPR